jgi:hypothetical protein
MAIMKMKTNLTNVKENVLPLHHHRQAAVHRVHQLLPRPLPVAATQMMIMEFEVNNLNYILFIFYFSQAI